MSTVIITTAAAMRAITDPDRPLLGGPSLGLDKEPTDGSTRWDWDGDLMIAFYGPGRTAGIILPLLFSARPPHLVLTENGRHVFELAEHNHDLPSLMERADDEAQRLGWTGAQG